MSAGALVGGIVLAGLAASCFDGAVALQALETRAVPTVRVGIGLLAALVRRPRWLAATALAVLGWPLQIAALTLAPLTVVQPALAVGLLVLLALGTRLLDEPARARDVAAAAAIAGGLALLAWAAPETERTHAGAVALGGVLAALAALAGAPWLLSGPGRRAPGLALVVAAGCGYAASGLTSKLLADALDGGAPAAATAWAALTAAVAGVALADEMAALQRVPAARVATGAFALQTIVPVVCAPLLTGEHWGRTPAGGGVIMIGVALVVAGGIVLGSAAAVGGLVARSHLD